MLTNSQISSAKPAGKPRKLFDVRGLYLKVMPNGGRYWRFNYRFNGKQKTLTLGTYPDVSLAKAREVHHEARRQLADGVDPGAVKQAGLPQPYDRTRLPGCGLNSVARARLAA